MQKNFFSKKLSSNLKVSSDTAPVMARKIRSISCRNGPLVGPKLTGCSGDVRLRSEIPLKLVGASNIGARVILFQTNGVGSTLGTI
jgi:hypothetical protein